MGQLGGSIISASKDEQTTWTLTLNKYQRDNLLWLINACGWPWGVHTVSPFGCANTGDWIGEVGWMLAKEGKEPLLDENGSPAT